MFIINQQDRSEFYNLIDDFFKKINLKPNLAELGVLKGDNASELAKIHHNNLYLIDAFSTQGMLDFVDINQNRPWVRSPNSLNNYFGGDIFSQKTFDNLYQIVKKRFLNSASIKIVKTVTTNIPQLIQQGMLPQSVDFIYIDAGHQYETVLDDLIIASQWLSPNGIIQMNDVIYGKTGLKQNLGVLDALAKFCKFSSLHPVLLQNRECGDLILSRRENSFQNYIFESLVQNKILFIDIPEELLFSAKWLENGISFSSFSYKSDHDHMW